MKKLLLAFILFSTFSVSAQYNEVKVDLLDLLLLRTLDVAYENHLNDEVSVGVSVFMNFEPKDHNFRYNEDFQITPYFRHFLTDSFGFDVFGELFGSLNFGETDKNDLGDTENYTDFAIGLGAGAKHISTHGYVFEAHVGLGRNLFNTSISGNFVPRFGISIGKQF